MGTIEAYTAEAGKRYRVIYRRPDHRQTSKRGFTTKREAELCLSSIEVAKARGEFVEPPSPAPRSLTSAPIGWKTKRTSSLHP
jgi:hypothetical protein